MYSVKKERKESMCRRCEFDPWVWKIPWRREWLPTPVFLLRKAHGWRSPMGYGPWTRKESDTTEWLILSKPSRRIVFSSENLEKRPITLADTAHDLRTHNPVVFLLGSWRMGWELCLVPAYLYFPLHSPWTINSCCYGGKGCCSHPWRSYLSSPLEQALSPGVFVKNSVPGPHTRDPKLWV